MELQASDASVSPGLVLARLPTAGLQTKVVSSLLPQWSSLVAASVLRMLVNSASTPSYHCLSAALARKVVVSSLVSLRGLRFEGSSGS